MKNITVTVGDEVYAQARRLAAAQRTSVSALVKFFLVGLRKLPLSAQRERIAQIQAEFAAMPVRNAESADQLARYCCSYTLATERGVPLLFKGNGFNRTGVQPAAT